MAMFLGIAGYYRTFISQYSALTNRLNGIKKAEKFLWKEEIETRFHPVKENIHKGRNTGFPGLWSRRSVHLNHQLEQGEHCGSVVAGPGQAGEIPWVFGKKLS